MKIKLVDLPGVGKKVSFINSELQMMSMIIHHSGNRELYLFEHQDDDEPAFTFALSAEETKQLATQMLSTSFNSMDYESVERLRLVRKQTVVEWIEVEKYAELLTKKYSDVKQSLPAGITVVGVFENEEFIVNPNDELILRDQHTLMIVGKNEAITQFVQKKEWERNN